MKKIFVITSVFLCILFFSSCSHYTKKSSDNLDNITHTISTTSNTIKFSFDKNIQIDAKISIPESLQDLKFNVVKAHRPHISEKKIKKLFTQKIDIAQQIIDDGYKSREIGNYHFTYLYGKNGEFVDISPMDIYFQIPDYEYYLNCLFTDPLFESYNLPHFSLTKELSFASRENTFQIIREYFDVLGISISDDYKAYALDHKKLQKEEKPMDTDGKILEDNKKESWTKKDDAYYFIFHQEVDDVPIRQVQYGDGFQGTGIEQTELMAVYGARGMIAFREYWGYVLEKTTEEKEIISLDRALESLQKKYEMLLTDSTLFDEIALELMPVFIKDNEYEIHPVWTFRGKLKLENGQNINTEVSFDGFSGQEIIS
ncbi:hypothetical protein [Eubacterium sp. An3]|uniref:hypothetical protein n=1 Tax=Eubacterium sp. An3 TaxID=1965628 RepID=UPI000B3A891F|nr:hypothetical protein [Eubacterium sp. An3]OUO27992.1 hypothetical protein B5F87_09180 [Eubacterium sp. An3]